MYDIVSQVSGTGKERKKGKHTDNPPKNATLVSVNLTKYTNDLLN